MMKTKSLLLSMSAWHGSMSSNQDFKVQGQTRANLATKVFIDVEIIRGTMEQARAALCAGYESTTGFDNVLMP
jgi:hypothetical protein